MGIKEILEKPAPHKINIDGYWLTNEEVDDLLLLLKIGDKKGGGDKKTEESARAARYRLVHGRDPKLKESFEQYFIQQGKTPAEARAMATLAAENRRDSGVKI